MARRPEFASTPESLLNRTVVWVSQAAGSHMRKEGVVVAVRAPGKHAWTWLSEDHGGRAMKVDWKNPPELDVTVTDWRSPIYWADTVSTRRESSEGAAPPRKRPRRVYRKLKKRGFAAHFCGTWCPEKQQAHTIYKAAVLAEMVGCSGYGTAVTIRFRPVLVDGDVVRPVGIDLAKSDKINVAKPPKLSLSIDDPIPTVLDCETFIGRKLGVSFDVIYRTVAAHQVIYCREDEDVMDTLAAQRFEAVAIDLAHVLTRAVRGYQVSWTVARQTSYRPVGNPSMEIFRGFAATPACARGRRRRTRRPRSSR